MYDFHLSSQFASRERDIRTSVIFGQAISQMEATKNAFSTTKIQMWNLRALICNFSGRIATGAVFCCLQDTELFILERNGKALPNLHYYVQLIVEPGFESFPEFQTFLLKDLNAPALVAGLRSIPQDVRRTLMDGLPSKFYLTIETSLRFVQALQDTFSVH